MIAASLLEPRGEDSFHLIVQIKYPCGGVSVCLIRYKILSDTSRL